MANEIYIDANTIFLKIKRSGDTDYRVVGCTQTNGFSINPTPRKINNKCTGGADVNTKGTLAWQFDFAGDAIVIDEDGTPAPDDVSFQVMAALAITQEEVDAIMANADESYYRGGKAIVSAYKEDANKGENLQFSFTLLGNYEPVLEKPETT